MSAAAVPTSGTPQRELLVKVLQRDVIRQPERRTSDAMLSAWIVVAGPFDPWTPETDAAFRARAR